MSRLKSFLLFLCFSLSTTTHAIQVAEQGQLLFAPLFQVSAEHQTDILIENPHPESAVKALISFRSQQSGGEMLNFGLYLAPEDSFSATLVQIDGRTYLQSNDDSMRSFNLDGSLMDNGSGQNFFVPRQKELDLSGFQQHLFADALSSQQPLFTHNLDAGEGAQSGYITVLGIYAVQGDVLTPTGMVKIEKGMPPSRLSTIFETARVSLEYSNGGETPANAGKSSNGNIRSTDPSWFQLKGQVALKHQNLSLTLPMTVLSSSQGTDAEGYDKRLISNPHYDHSVGGIGGIAHNLDDANIAYAIPYQESSSELGIGFSFGGIYQDFLIPAYDNILLIEAALAQTKIRLNPNKPVQQLLVTFPLRYRRQNTVCSAAAQLYDFQYAPPFDYAGNVAYRIRLFNSGGQLKSTLMSGVFHSDVNSLPLRMDDWETGDYLELSFENDEACPAFAGIPALVSLQALPTANFWQASEIDAHVHALVRSGQVGEPLIFDIFSARSPDDQQMYDLYAGLILPSQRLLGISTTGNLELTLSPFYRGALTGERLFSVFNTSLASEVPIGNYQLCALVTLAGVSPYQVTNWQGFHCETVSVQH